MQKNIYFHSVGFIINDNRFNIKNEEAILDQIFECGELLSLRNQGKPNNHGFCGLDYISLCDYERSDKTNQGIMYYNGFYIYIRRLLSIIFDKEIVNKETKIYDTNLVRPMIHSNDLAWREEMRECSEYDGERYSDLPDEVQVKDRLSLNGMIGLSFPTEQFLVDIAFDTFSFKKDVRYIRKVDALKRERDIILMLEKKYGYNVKLYDVDTLKEMTDENIDEIVSKKLTKK